MECNDDRHIKLPRSEENGRRGDGEKVMDVDDIWSILKDLASKGPRTRWVVDDGEARSQLVPKCFQTVVLKNDGFDQMPVLRKHLFFRPEDGIFAPRLLTLIVDEEYFHRRG